MATKVLVYSDDHTVREDVRYALGSKLPGSDQPIEIVEVATGPALLSLLDRDDDIELAILDGESTPVGGMGLAKQLKDEYDPCPLILLLVGRTHDAWLAAWSGADAIHPHPIDPIELADLAGRLLQPATV
ncbi:MAG: response regulator [Propionibacteriaceae bacterium]|jgi:DNA-binding NtrC family response regulator|nr:response regulator [Propionibacteriaceae bacterium]